MFSKMPSDFVYFKQYNITAKHMYENLLALHTVDQKNQDVVTEDVYIKGVREQLIKTDWTV